MIDRKTDRPKVSVIEPKDITGRAKLVHILSSMDFDVEHYQDGETFLQDADRFSRGCVVSLLRLGGMSGIEVQASLAERNSLLPVILVSEGVSPQIIVRAMRNGAVSFLASPINEDELWMAVREALSENADRLYGARHRNMLAARFSQLSKGEWDVLLSICKGLSNKEIAISLDVSVRTVETRKKRLLTKTESNSIPDLAMSYQRYLTAFEITDDPKAAESVVSWQDPASVTGADLARKPVPTASRPVATSRAM